MSMVGLSFVVTLYLVCDLFLNVTSPVSHRYEPLTVKSGPLCPAMKAEIAPTCVAFQRSMSNHTRYILELRSTIVLTRKGVWAAPQMTTTT